MEGELTQIQMLQFKDKAEAEKRLLAFLREQEGISVTSVQLNPKPESLNSLNGLATFSDGNTYFFKSHTEGDEKISEYYNASILADHGYPIAIPKQVRKKPGQQIAFYETISFPTLFDVTKEEEDALLGGSKLTEKAKKIMEAQIALDKRTFEIYKRTLAWSTGRENSKAPIHQLFYNRLPEDGRLGQFYIGKDIRLPSQEIPFTKLAKLKWVINGVRYAESIDEVVERSRRLLYPERGSIIIVGHGDAHNGNIWYDRTNNALLYFDPAFAGRHNPFLDITKPLFHNVFARWMYFPEQAETEFSISYRIEDGTIYVTHNYFPSDLRVKAFESKLRNVLYPLVGMLDKSAQLPSNWADYLRSSMFCCPFLTVNLAADYNPQGKIAERYSPVIKLLGLCMTVEMGSAPMEGKSRIADLTSRIYTTR